MAVPGRTSNGCPIDWHWQLSSSNIWRHQLPSQVSGPINKQPLSPSDRRQPVLVSSHPGFVTYYPYCRLNISASTTDGCESLTIEKHCLLILLQIGFDDLLIHTVYLCRFLELSLDRSGRQNQGESIVDKKHCEYSSMMKPKYAISTAYIRWPTSINDKGT
jgi:hypothetical protein